MTDTPMRRTPRRRRRRDAARRRAIRLSLFTLLLLGTVGAIFFAALYMSSRTIRDTVSVVVSREDQPEKAFPGHDYVNILFLGKDEDRDNKDRVVHTRGRTDAIMFAHIDFRNHDANILSIPRDSLVRIPGYRGKRRINSAHALGGPDLTKQTIENLVGVAPDYYALMDYSGFERAIDEIGGVTVNVDKQLDYDDEWGNLHIHLKQGKQTLNGRDSMGFVRYRHANAGGGDSDLVRISRQQELISSVKGRLMQPGVIVKVPKVLDIVCRDLKTDMTPAQMICLARFLRSVPAKPGVKMVTMPTRPGSGNYIRPDVEETRELANRLFRGSSSSEAGTSVSLDTTVQNRQ